MKKLFILSLGFAVSLGACAPYAYVPPPPPGPVVGGVAVAVGDRPYYVRGPYYVAHGRRWVWVNGHWVHRHGRHFWVHGRYVVRG